MFYHDTHLDIEASGKAEAGCRAPLKEAATEYIPTYDHEKIIQSFLIMNDRGYFRPDMCLTVVSINQGILLFHKPIEEVREIVRRVSPPVKGKVSSNQLQKMVAIRIERIHKVIKNTNDSRKQYHEWQKQNASKASPLVILELPDFNTVQEFQEYVNTAQEYDLRGLANIQKEIKRSLLSKPELTDADVAGGMALIVAGMVMEE